MTKGLILNKFILICVGFPLQIKCSKLVITARIVPTCKLFSLGNLTKWIELLNDE